MNPSRALLDGLLAMADDELILAHRNSEWCGHAPILEEDIAFANLALDELGHALLWYRALAGLKGEAVDTYPDQLVYQRSAAEFRCSHFVALPNRDFGFSMLRQYLFDEFEAVRLESLVSGASASVSEAAAKIRVEERYHLRHTRSWVKRLALGTDESHRRIQDSLNTLWSYTGQLFGAIGSSEEDPEKPDWTEAVMDMPIWLVRVTQFIDEVGLSIPVGAFKMLDRKLPSQHLVDILAELQQVARLDPGAEW